MRGRLAAIDWCRGAGVKLYGGGSFRGSRTSPAPRAGAREPLLPRRRTTSRRRLPTRRADRTGCRGARCRAGAVTAGSSRRRQRRRRRGAFSSSTAGASRRARARSRWNVSARRLRELLEAAVGVAAAEAGGLAEAVRQERHEVRPDGRYAVARDRGDVAACAPRGVAGSPRPRKARWALTPTTPSRSPIARDDVVVEVPHRAVQRARVGVGREHRRRGPLERSRDAARRVRCERSRAIPSAAELVEQAHAERREAGAAVLGRAVREVVCAVPGRADEAYAEAAQRRDQAGSRPSGSTPSSDRIPATAPSRSAASSAAGSRRSAARPPTPPPRASAASTWRRAQRSAPSAASAVGDEDREHLHAHAGCPQRRQVVRRGRRRARRGSAARPRRRAGRSAGRPSRAAQRRSPSRAAMPVTTTTTSTTKTRSATRNPTTNKSTDRIAISACANASVHEIWRTV